MIFIMYCTIIDKIHKYLLPSSYLEPIRTELNEWTPELVKKLDLWLSKLVLTVLEHQKRNEEKEKNPEN